MFYQVDYSKIIEKINPIIFSKYLEDTGWKRFRTKRTDIRIFQKEEKEFYQVTIPMDESLGDYYEALMSACEKVAKQEGRTLDQLILCLLNPNSDILKIRIEKKDVEAGSILLDDAIGVYENVKRLLGAAAQDVLKPSVIHQGRTDTTVMDFMSICKFGQTEIGSYIVSVICPMTEVRDGEIRQLEFFENKEEINFTRRVTTKVIKSIQQLKERIDSGQYNLASTSLEDQISVNFYEALLGINLADEGVKIDFSPEWTPGLKAPEDLPSVISLSHQYYAPIQASICKIRGTVKKRSKIVGRIKKLEASPDVESRKAGKITVIYVDDNNKARTIIATLEKSDYDRAVEAHAKGWYVEIIGETSGKRGNKITCDGFNVL